MLSFSRTSFIPLLLLALLVSVQGQEGGILATAEYGDIAELKTMNRVYVATESLTARNNIVAELKKYKGLEIVSRPEDAEFFIAYEVSVANTGASLIGSSVVDNQVVHGNMIVLVKSAGPDGQARPRILWSAYKHQDFTGGLTLNRNPSVNATREFIKALKKVRDVDTLQPSGGHTEAPAPPANNTESSTAPHAADRVEEISRAGLSFTMPDGWAVTDKSTAASSLFVLESKAVVAQITITALTEEVAPSTALDDRRKDLTAQFVENMARQFEAQGVKSERMPVETQIGSETVYGVRLRAAPDGRPGSVDVFTFLSGPRLIMLTFIRDDAAAPFSESAWALIRRSLKVAGEHAESNKKGRTA